MASARSKRTRKPANLAAATRHIRIGRPVEALKQNVRELELGLQKAEKAIADLNFHRSLAGRGVVEPAPERRTGPGPNDHQGNTSYGMAVEVPTKAPSQRPPTALDEAAARLLGVEHTLNMMRCIVQEATSRILGTSAAIDPRPKGPGEDRPGHSLARLFEQIGDVEYQMNQLGKEVEHLCKPL